MITLAHGATRGVIDPEGAWIRELVAGDTPVYFPKSKLANEMGVEKTRGGMHVCLPNFGSGGDSGLDQHGFGRTSLWTILQQSENATVLELRASNGAYAGLVATLTYTLSEHSLSARLALTNEGSAVLRIAPGFHPYFALNSSEDSVTVNNVSYKLSELAGTEFITAKDVTLETAELSISVAQSNLSTWAIWTDGLADYVCVEPTFGGYRFLKPPTPDEQLAPGAERVFSCTIRWR